MGLSQLGSEPPERGLAGVWRLVGILILVLAFGLLAYHLRAALYPLLFGGLLAIALFPSVRKIETRRLRRPVAALAVFALVFLAAALLLLFTVGQLGRISDELFATGPEGEQRGAAYKAVEAIEKLYEEADRRFGLGEKGKAWLEDLPQKLAASWEEIAKTAGGALQLAVRVVGSLLDFLSLVFLTPLFAFLILLEYERILTAFVGLARPPNQGRVRDLLSRTEILLGRFLRGRLLTGFLKGLLQALALLLCGVPFPWFTGLLSWLLSFLPLVGPVLAFLPVAILLTAQGSWGLLLVVLGILILGELVEGYVFLPAVVGPEVGLSTLELLLALLIGGAALGFLGLFLAVPVAAVGKLLLTDYLEHREAAL